MAPGLLATEACALQLPDFVWRAAVGIGIFLLVSFCKIIELIFALLFKLQTVLLRPHV